jgi:hypothetical protein
MPTDLVVLAADKNTEYGLRGLLARHRSLGIRAISVQTYVHPNHDPGCAQKSHEFLHPFCEDYARAIVVFDHDGCGREHRTPIELEEDVRQQLAANGWGNRAAAIVIDPELESWVFAASPHVETCIGWSNGVRAKAWLHQQGFWPADAIKPPDPKAALEAALRKLKRPRSSSIYKCLAESVGLNSCVDPAFARLKGILQPWFPPVGE